MSTTSKILLPVLFCVLLSGSAFGQPGNRKELLDRLEKEGCVQLDKIKVCKFDYAVDGKNVEALSFRPSGAGPFPGVMLIPGYQRSAPDYIFLGRVLGEQGFACMAVTQPGFGKSAGPADFVGPKTIAALTVGFRKFQHESYVDTHKLGIFGYSRGGMAASLLAVKLKHLRAAVFGAGVYDFQKAYDEVKIQGIRDNMLAETGGMSAQAVKERSSILQMKNLRCPVLILHGAKDQNVPVSQAFLLRDRLQQLKKRFDLSIYPDAEHSIPPSDWLPVVISFLHLQFQTHEPDAH
jgi:dipeptidyl aminopeptidase/acylaminoacyl peptidase